MLHRHTRVRRLGVASLAGLAVTAVTAFAGPTAMLGAAHAATGPAAPGTVYVSDEDTGVIHVIAPDNSETTIGSFDEPDGIALDSAGNLYVANDTYQGGFYKLTPDGTQTDLGFTGIEYPWQVAVDSAGNVYGMGYSYDAGRQIIEKMTPGGVQSDVPVAGSNYLSALATDAAGDLYVTDYSSAVFKVTPDGTTTTVGTGWDEPEGVAVDEHGNVFVADYGARSVVKFATDGTQSTMQLGPNFGPEAIATGPGGYLYVNNDDNGGTYQFDPSGNRTVLGQNLPEYTYGIAAVQSPRTAQPITFNTNPGAAPAVGQSYTAAVNAGASGQPVNFAGTPGVCSAKAYRDSSATVTLIGAGTCVVTASQAGNRGFTAGSGQQSFGVEYAQAITFTSHSHKARVGKTYTATATGGTSANPVVFAKGAKSGHACTVSSTGEVVFKYAHPCTIVATQAGDATHYAAPRTFQTIRVRRGVQHVHFTTKAPKGATAGTTYHAKATGGASGNKVKISVTGPCKVDKHGLVTFKGSGTCVVMATQAGNADYLVGRAMQDVKVG